MEARMTICNMSIEMGARCGMIAPDETTFSYMKGRKFAPQGADWDKKLAYWKTLQSDEGAVFDIGSTDRDSKISKILALHQDTNHWHNHIINQRTYNFPKRSTNDYSYSQIYHITLHSKILKFL